MPISIIMLSPSSSSARWTVEQTGAIKLTDGYIAVDKTKSFTPTWYSATYGDKGIIIGARNIADVQSVGLFTDLKEVTLSFVRELSGRKESRPRIAEGKADGTGPL